MPRGVVHVPVHLRFWSKVRKTDSCWLWQGSFFKSGYGRINDKIRGCCRAHRLAYELAKGPIGEGLVVCHKCDNKACVNPDHLFLGTVLDNVADRVAKGRTSSGNTSYVHVHPESVRGARNGRAKLNESDVRQIKSLLPSTGCRELAERFGVSDAAIHQIKTGRNWPHVEAPGKLLGRLE